PAFALTTFGRPDRDVEVVCDCDRDNQATMLQALYLANHPQVRQKISQPNGRLTQIMQIPEGDERVTEVFLSTLSRPPTTKELGLARKHIEQAGSPQKGLEGLMWSLMNCNDFLFNQ